MTDSPVGVSSAIRARSTFPWRGVATKEFMLENQRVAVRAPLTVIRRTAQSGRYVVQLKNKPEALGEVDVDFVDEALAWQLMAWVKRDSDAPVKRIKWGLEVNPIQRGKLIGGTPIPLARGSDAVTLKGGELAEICESMGGEKGYEWRVENTHGETMSFNFTCDPGPYLTDVQDAFPQNMLCGGFVKRAAVEVGLMDRESPQHWIFRGARL